MRCQARIAQGRQCHQSAVEHVWPALCGNHHRWSRRRGLYPVVNREARLRLFGLADSPEQREPILRGELQETADLAHAMLALDSMRQYGLVTGGPGVDVERCRNLLARAAAAGIVPSSDAVERVLGAMATEAV